MTLRQLPTDNAPQRIRPEHTPRLRLKPKAPQSGFVDGADGHQRHPVSTVEVIGLVDSRIALLANTVR